MLNTFSCVSRRVLFFFGHSSDLRRCRDNAGPLTHCAPENPANLLMSGLIDSQLLLFVFLVFVSTLNLLQLSHASGNPFYTHKRIKVKRHCLSSRMTNGFHIMVAPFFFFCLVFSRAAPTAHGVSQARGLSHNHSNARSKPHLWPTPQFTATQDP